MFLADQYVQQDHFSPCAILRNVIAMKYDAKLYRETPRDSSDSCAAQRNGRFMNMHVNAAAGLLESRTASGQHTGQFFLGPREDSPPSAKDKAPGEKQMPPTPYVPLAVASESA